MATMKDTVKNGGKKRGNIENLDPVKTKEEARKRGRNGGIKSQQVQRERRNAKECMNMILKMKATGKNAKKLMDNMGIESKDQQNIMLLMATLFARASSTGDPNAIKSILEIAGDLNTQAEQQAPTININVTPATKEDMDSDF